MAIQVIKLKTTLKASSFFREYISSKGKFKIDINVGLNSEKIGENLKEFVGNSKMEILIKDPNKEIEYKGEYIVEFKVKTDNEETLMQEEVDEIVVKSAANIIFPQIEEVFKNAGFDDFELTGTLEKVEDKKN